MVRAPESGTSAGGSAAGGSANGCASSEVPQPPRSWLMPPQRMASTPLPTYDWHMYGDLGGSWDSHSWGGCPESLSSSRGMSPCRKRLGRCCNWAWVLLVLGKLLIVTAGLLSGMYFSIRAITTSLEHVETIPTYANAILLVCLGIVFVFLYKRQDPIMLATGLVLCVICTVLCMASAVLLGVRAIRTMDDFAYCRYNDGKHQCHCYLAAHPTPETPQTDAAAGLNVEYVYAGAINCELIEQNLHDYICVLCAGYVMAVILCNATTVVAVVYFRHERQKASLLQYENEPDMMLPRDLPPGAGNFHFSAAPQPELPPPPPPPAPAPPTSQIFSRHITLPGLGPGHGAARLLSQSLCLPGDDHAHLLRRQASDVVRNRPEADRESVTCGGLPGGSSSQADTAAQPDLVHIPARDSARPSQTEASQPSTASPRFDFPVPENSNIGQLNTVVGLQQLESSGAIHFEPCGVEQVESSGAMHCESSGVQQFEPSAVPLGESSARDSPDPSAVWCRNPDSPPALTEEDTQARQIDNAPTQLRLSLREPSCGIRGCDVDLFGRPPPGMIANWVHRADPIEIGPVSRSRTRRRREMARRTPFFQHTNLPCCAGGSSSGRSSRNSVNARSRPLSQHLAFHYWMSGFSGFWPPGGAGAVYPYPVEPPPPYCPHQLPPYMEHDPVPEYRSRATTPVTGSMRSDSSSSSVHALQHGGSTGSVPEFTPIGSTGSVPDFTPGNSTGSIPVFTPGGNTGPVLEFAPGGSTSSVPEFAPGGSTHQEPASQAGCSSMDAHPTSAHTGCDGPPGPTNPQEEPQNPARKQGNVIETTV